MVINRKLNPVCLYGCRSFGMSVGWSVGRPLTLSQAVFASLPLLNGQNGLCFLSLFSESSFFATHPPFKLLSLSEPLIINEANLWRRPTWDWQSFNLPHVGIANLLFLFFGLSIKEINRKYGGGEEFHRGRKETKEKITKKKVQR